MPLINCEINLILTWSANSVISSNTITNQATTFSITDTKLHVLVVTLSSDNNEKLLQQLRSGLKCTISCNKYRSKTKIQAPSQYLDYVIDPSFQGVNRFFVLSFEDNALRKVRKRYFFPTVKINFMIDGKNVFEQSVKNHMRTYESIQKMNWSRR